MTAVKWFHSSFFSPYSCCLILLAVNKLKQIQISLFFHHSLIIHFHIYPKLKIIVYQLCTSLVSIYVFSKISKSNIKKGFSSLILVSCPNEKLTFFNKMQELHVLDSFHVPNDNLSETRIIWWIYDLDPWNWLWPSCNDWLIVLCFTPYQKYSSHLTGDLHTKWFKMHDQLMSEIWILKFHPWSFWDL